MSDGGTIAIGCSSAVLFILGGVAIYISKIRKYRKRVQDPVTNL